MCDQVQATCPDFQREGGRVSENSDDADTLRFELRNLIGAKSPLELSGQSSQSPENLMVPTWLSRISFAGALGGMATPDQLPGHTPPVINTRLPETCSLDKKSPVCVTFNGQSLKVSFKRFHGNHVVAFRVRLMRSSSTTSARHSVLLVGPTRLCACPSRGRWSALGRVRKGMARRTSSHAATVC